jgi:hypothetical protein
LEERVGERRQEAGGRRQEAGGRRQEAPSSQDAKKKIYILKYDLLDMPFMLLV